MARASTFTLLPLDTYAKVLGINPAHFNQAGSSSIFPIGGSCTDVWFQYSWQDADRISREQIARAIFDAEEDIASVLGFYPAPRWVSKEIHDYPQYHRREFFGTGLNVRGLFKSVIASKGKFIEAGQRAVTLLGTPTVVYTDPDGDGFDELATVTQATVLTDACKINTYFVGENGEQEWEIRPAKTKVITGGNFVATYDSWLFLNPDLWEAFPGTGTGNLSLDDPKAIDLSNTANRVTTVDVYREFTDFSQESAEFSWEPKPQNVLFTTFCTSCGGSGCVACENPIQTGCLHVRDVERGILVPTPATFDATTGQWSHAQWVECREPDTVKVWYKAGDLDEKLLRTDSCIAMSNKFAHPIAWIATARLERPPCSCNNVQALFEDLRKDLAFVGDASFQVDPVTLDNPFGSKKGEIMAWKRISQLTPAIGDFALV